MASYATTSKNWSGSDLQFVAEQLVTANPVEQPRLWDYLTPISGRLVPDLEQIFQKQDLPESRLIGAANALKVFANDNRNQLTRLLTTATPAQYEILYPLVSSWADGTAKAVLADIVAGAPNDNMSEKERVALGQQRAGAAISLLRMGEVKKSYGAFQIGDDPESLTQFVHRCRDRDVTAMELVESLRRATNGHSRFALLLALGDYLPADIDKGQHDVLIKELTEAYRTDPSSAIHGATGWLLRKWGFEQEVAQVDHTPLSYDETGERQWYVQEFSPKSTGVMDLRSGILSGRKQADQMLYFTFVVFPPGEYLMGSPEDEEDRNVDEQLHRVKLTRPLAVSMYETTWAQYDALAGGQKHAAWEQQFRRKLTPEEPAFGVNWFEAVDYCRVLTQQAGWTEPESEQCYEDPQSLPKDAEGNPQHSAVQLNRRGFRLLTEAEWEYVCRSGMGTAYSFGSDQGLLTHYGWFQDNSQKWSHVVGQLRPNVRGLFDLHGNLLEWCYDWYEPDVSDGTEDPTGAKSGSYRVCRGGSWSRSASLCRAAYRLGCQPYDRNGYLGFRVAAVPSASPAGSKSGAERGGG